MQQTHSQQATWELIHWQHGIELLAHHAYTAAAEALHNDRALSQLLQRLAGQEEEHAALMAAIARHADAAEQDRLSGIRLDATTRYRIERPLRNLQDDLDNNSLTRERMLRYIMAIEFSEVCDIFQYLYRRFGAQLREMEHMAAAVQEHLDTITRFIATMPRSERLALEIDTLPSVWTRRVLLVDDNEDLRELLSLVLRRQSEVMTAANGRDALELLDQHYFNAVVSDLQMPVMDGITLYREAITTFPDLQNRFLFISAAPTPEQEAIITEQQLPFLAKPFDLDELCARVQQIMERE